MNYERTPGNQRRRTRRDVLRIGAAGLLAAGFGTAAEAADEFHFLVVNDVHYVDEHCGRWLEGVVRRMNAHPEKPEFCLIAGDLAENGQRAQLAGVRDVVHGLGMPVYVVIGNHDYLVQDDRKAYDDLFPGRTNYAFEHRGWHILGLDTSEGQHYMNTSIQLHTFRFLEETLPKLDRKRPCLVFTHFPLGPDVLMRPKNADDLLARFRAHRVPAVFGGHFHGYTERKLGETTFTTDKCCSLRRENHDGTKEKGYFLCRAKDGKVRHTFIEVPVPPHPA